MALIIDGVLTGHLRSVAWPAVTQYEGGEMEGASLGNFLEILKSLIILVFF